MWQLDKRQQIMWVAWASNMGCFNIGCELEPMFAGYAADRERLWGAKCLAEFEAWWLPQLASHSLLIPNDCLRTFAGECREALAILEELCFESRCAAGDVDQALRNMIRVAGEAQVRRKWVEIHSGWLPYSRVPQLRF